MPSLATIKRLVDRLASEIDAPERILPTYGRSEDMARPHIEVAGPHMSWVVVERGTEWERRTTEDLDELLYWIFESVTHEMASRYAVQHRDTGRDFRYPLFTKQLELMAQLNSGWRPRLASRLGPYLREAGLPPE